MALNKRGYKLSFLCEVIHSFKKYLHCDRHRANRHCNNCAVIDTGNVAVTSHGTYIPVRETDKCQVVLSVEKCGDEVGVEV